MKLGALVLFVALLAGCTTPPAPVATPAPAFVDEPIAALALAPPDRVVRAPLDVAVVLSDLWLKPLRPLDVALETSAAARVAWFIEHEEVEPRATIVDGDIFILKSTTPDHHNTAGPRAPVTVSELAADGRARSMMVPTAGRYTLEGDGVRFVVNAWAGAPEGAAQAFLVEEGGELRFEPPEIDVAPGARVLLWSQASRTLELRESRFAAYVPLEAREGRITPIDEGLYRLVALAVAGDARGVARTAFLVDFERPSDRLEFGPYTGDLMAPEAALDAPRRLGFRAAHELETLVIEFSASSNVPAPASIVVALFHDDELLGEASSVAASELVFADLPAGKYSIEVRGEHGVLVGYEIGGEGRYRLPTPARLRESAT